jgi:hypothetical protein
VGRKTDERSTDIVPLQEMKALETTRETLSFKLTALCDFDKTISCGQRSRSPQVVPEPSIATMILFAGIGLFPFLRRDRG